MLRFIMQSFAAFQGVDCRWPVRSTPFWTGRTFRLWTFGLERLLDYWDIWTGGFWTSPIWTISTFGLLGYLDFTHLGLLGYWDY